MAGWSSLVARLAHNQEVVCSNHILRNLLSAFVKQTSVVWLTVNSPDYLLFRRNTFRKKVILIVRLNNYKEVQYLVSKGVKYGYEGLSVTHSRHSGKTWYMCCSRNNMRLLNEYRRNIKIK